MSSPECLFCKLVRQGRPRATRRTASSRSEDINPKADVHLLVLPERHVDTFLRDVGDFSAEESKRMLEFVAETARQADLEDYRVIVNVGRGAWPDGLPLALARARRTYRGRVRMSLIAKIEDDTEGRDARRATKLRTGHAPPDPCVVAVVGEGAPVGRSADEERQVLQRERKRRTEAAEPSARPVATSRRDRGGASSRSSRSSCRSRPRRGRARADRRRRDRRDGRDVSPRPRARDGRRDAPGRGPRRRLGREPARPREARLIRGGPARLSPRSARPACEFPR